MISHLLAVLASQLPDRIVFFGGTALARTHLVHGRLSEDLDLIAMPSRASVVTDLEVALAEGVRREHGRLSWQPRPPAVSSTQPASLRSADGLVVRVQLLDRSDVPAWPTERRRLHQRYSDVPTAALTVLTLESFAASKTAAWHDRHAARDLYDLWGLAGLGALTEGAAKLFARLGPTGHPPRDWMFRDAPSSQHWLAELAGQTRLTVQPAEALAVVADAWSRAVADLGG